MFLNFSNTDLYDYFDNEFHFKLFENKSKNEIASDWDIVMSLKQ